MTVNNTSEALSVLRFKDYMVNEVVFKRNLTFQNKEVELQFHFDAQIHISTEKDRAIVDLTCTVFDEQFNANAAPFYMKLSMKGVFECSDLEIENFKINAVAILLPFMRATMASYTIQTGLPAVLIPPINVYTLFKEEEKL